MNLWNLGVVTFLHYDETPQLVESIYEAIGLGPSFTPRKTREGL